MASSKRIATHFDGKRLNSPNDVVVRSDGRIFFTDPPYGITEDQRELPYNGVFSIDVDGELTLLATDFERPNGLAFSPDERTLYIADTARHHVRAFDVAADGALSSEPRLRRDARGGPPGRHEGRPRRPALRLRDDRAGLRGRRPPARRHRLPAIAGELRWGEDGSTLFITARTAVYRTRVETTGIAPHLR